MGTSVEGVPFPLIEPVGTVRSDQPTLRWQPLAGATTYVARVFDTNFAEVAKSEALNDQAWRVSMPLPRGRTYIWQITAIKDGQETKSPTAPAPEAKFKVVSMDLETRIRQAQATNSHLVLGVLYAEAGLLKDAEREFRLLLKANPDSPIASKFVQQVVNAR